MIEQDSRLALGLAYIQARLSKSVSDGASPCVQSQAFQSDQQPVSAALLPQENVLTAHLPLTTKTGSLAPLRDSTTTSLEQLCTILRDLAMSGCVSDTPPIMCAPVHISFDGCLRSKHGEQWLNATMDGCAEPWWIELQHAKKIAAAISAVER
jgi:hypothetical protein